MKTLTFIALLLTANTYAADATKGETLYKACISCHGPAGEGNEAMKAPRLSGQHDWYIVTQLKAFKALERKNPTMLPFIKNLSEKDYEDLAAYISKM